MSFSPEILKILKNLVYDNPEDLRNGFSHGKEWTTLKVVEIEIRRTWRAMAQGQRVAL